MKHNALQHSGHVALALLLVLFSHPALAATIIVDETTCTLVDAIDSANTDSAVGGCTAGSGSGHDRIDDRCHAAGGEQSDRF